MPVQNLDDVRNFLGHVRHKVVQRVEGLTPEQQAWRPAPGKWSALEHLEHLALAEQHLLPRLEAMIAEGEARGLRAAPDSPRQVDAGPVLQSAGAVGTPKQAPAQSRPTGRSLADIREMLARSRARLLALSARLDHLDTDQVTTHYGVAGATFNAAQFLHFLGIHEWLHDQHIQNNLKAWQQQAQQQ